MLIQALLAKGPPKAPDPRDPVAIRQYEVDLQNWYLAQGVNPLAGAARNPRALSRDDRTGGVDRYGLLPGGSVSGGLLRVGGQDLLDGAKSSLASVLSPGRGYVAP
jgi:hypothetical protein